MLPQLATAFKQSTRTSSTAQTAVALGAIAILSISAIMSPSFAYATTNNLSVSNFQPQTDLPTEPENVNAEPDWPIDVHARIGQDGLLQVTETFEWDTGQVEPPFLRALPLFVPRTDSMWRKFEYSDFLVRSDTAKFELSILDDSHQLLAAITQVTPDPTEDSSLPVPSEKLPNSQPAETKHKVVFTYQVRGATSVLAPTKEIQNELFWSPLASGGTERSTLNFRVTAESTATSLSCRVLLDDRNMLGWAKALDNAESDPLPEDVTTDNPLCVPDRKSGKVYAAQLNRLSTVIVNATYPVGTVHSDSSIPVEEPDKSPVDLDQAGTTTEFDPTWSENIDFGLDQGTGPILPIVAGLGAACLLVALWFLLRTRPDYTFPGISSGDVASIKAKEQQLHPVDRPGKRRPLDGTVKASKKIYPANPTKDLEALPIELFGALSTLVLSPPQILAMLVSLALRGFLHFEQVHTTSNNKGTGKAHTAWRITRLNPESGSESEISGTEKRLLDSIFVSNTQIEAHTLHSVFAPQFLEILALIGNDAQQRGLTIEPVGHAAMASARRTQRTPLGRAYAEQLEGLRAQLLNAPDTITDKVLPALIAMGNESQWESATSGVIAPDFSSWLTVPEENTPDTVSEVLTLLHSMLSTSESPAHGF